MNFKSIDCGKVYEKIEIVGSGASGVVWKARNTETGELVALKCVPASEACDEGLSLNSVREVKILQGLSHPNVVEVKDVLYDDAGDQVMIVFEFLNHDLSGIINDCSIDMNEAIVKSLTKQLLEAVAYIHSHNIMHRDIKSSNLLLSCDGSLKLADFGLARKCDLGSTGYSCNVVTRWYRAPEVLLGDSHYDFAIDIWSVGCILAELMFKTPLFPGDDEEDQLHRIFSLLGTPDYEDWPEALHLPNWSAPLFPSYSRLYDHCQQFGANPVIDLLRQLLCLNPAKRITAAEALKHPWFSQNPITTTTTDDHSEESSATLVFTLPESSRNEAWVRRIIEESTREKMKRKREEHEIQQQQQQPYKKRKYSALSASSCAQPDVCYQLTKKRRQRYV